MEIEDIKKKFFDYRVKRGLSWADLAAKAGVNNYQQIISYFNKGVTLASICKLAALVDVEPWQLLKPDDTNTQPKTPDNRAQITCPHCGETITLTIE